jgi:hypothetical protein
MQSWPQDTSGATATTAASALTRLSPNTCNGQFQQQHIAGNNPLGCKYSLGKARHHTPLRCRQYTAQASNAVSRRSILCHRFHAPQTRTQVGHKLAHKSTTLAHQKSSLLQGPKHKPTTCTATCSCTALHPCKSMLYRHTSHHQNHA